MWTHAVARPFFKGDLVGVRPVLCAEALLKFAVACCVQGASPAIRHAVDEHQLGAGKSGGASLKASQVRAAATKPPHLCLATLDVQKAFGAVEWADALLVATVVKKAPQLAHLLAAMWRPRRMAIWLQEEAGPGWHVIYVFGSLVQGGHEASPTLCLVIAVVIEQASGRLQTAAVWAFFLDPRRRPHRPGRNPPHAFRAQSCE